MNLDPKQSHQSVYGRCLENYRQKCMKYRNRYQAQLPLLPAESGVPGGFCYRHQEASGTTPPTKYKYKPEPNQ